MNIITTASAAVICAYSIWACLSRRYDDGIFGKVLLFGAAVASLAMLLTGKNEHWLEVVFAAFCLRYFWRLVIWPTITGRYPNLGRGKHDHH